MRRFYRHAVRSVSRCRLGLSVSLALVALIVIGLSPARVLATDPPIKDGTVMQLHTVPPEGTPLCLDIHGASKRDGANLIQWTCDDTAANQQFKFDHVGDGYYTIKAQHSRKCLDVWWSLENGSKIIQWSCNGLANQLWKVIHNHDDASFTFQSKHSGLVMDIEAASMDKGAFIIQWPDHDGWNQKFK